MRSFVVASLMVLAGCASGAFTDARDLPRCPESSEAEGQEPEEPDARWFRPRLQNQDEISRLLEERYPPYLREMRIGGTTNVWVFVETDGHVSKVRINKSSGFDGFDQAALGIARSMDFVPAVKAVPEERCAIPVWVALNLTFSVERD